MYARAEGSKVKVGLWFNDPETYLPQINELVEAQAEYEAHRTDLSVASLRSSAERMLAAEQDVEDAFSDEYTIEQAERLAGQLYYAIQTAKANDGRFDGGDE